MPRLQGYRERRHADLYMGIDLERFCTEMVPIVRLDESVNQGNPMFTNCPQRSADQTFVVLALRMRTNIPANSVSPQVKEIMRDAFIEGRDDDALKILAETGAWAARSPLRKAFEEWLHVTKYTFVIGSRITFDCNAFDLLSGTLTNYTQPDDDATVQAKQRERERITKVQQRERRTGIQAAPEDLQEKNTIKTKINGTRLILARPMIIPVRQSWNIELLTSAPNIMLPTLAKAIKAAETIHPFPALWVHTEGLETRDVA